jgi:hypothetical protein
MHRLKSKDMNNYINKLLFNIRLKAAIKRAKRNAALFNCRYMVIVFAGKPMVYSKKQLKEALKIRFFKKGTTIQQLEKIAVFTTLPIHQHQTINTKQ